MSASRMFPIFKQSSVIGGKNLERDILDRVLNVLSLGALTILILSSSRIWFEGFEPKLGLIWIIALGILGLKYFGQKLSAKSIGYVLFVFFSIMGFIALTNDGLASIGSIFLFLGLSTSSVVLGERKLFLLVGLQFVIFLILVALINQGILVPLPEEGAAYLLSPRTWVFHGIVIAVGSIISFYGSSILGGWYRDSMVAAEDNLYNAIAILSLARDTETGEHIERVSRYSTILYEAFQIKSGIEDKFSKEDLGKAVRLHDIGKIAISDAILKKPGKLTKPEFQEMKRHCEIGADIIASIVKNSKVEDPVLVLAEQIAVAHHENWDGSGYPNGLTGKEIPLAARIMAIADVYDALRSRRPYKPPYTHEEALNIMDDEKYKFDPALYALFISKSGLLAQTFGEIK